MELFLLIHLKNFDILFHFEELDNGFSQKPQLS